MPEQTVGRRVTISQIARELHVSPATVSRALNHSSLVRSELAQSIRSHARDRGYPMSKVGRFGTVKTTQAISIGILVPDLSTEAYRSIALELGSAALSIAESSEIDPVPIELCITRGNPYTELNHVKHMIAKGTSGIILTPSVGMLQETRDLLARVPVVQLHRGPDSDLDSVLCEDEHSMAESVLHLAALGHSEIGFIGSEESPSSLRCQILGLLRGAALARLPEGSIRTISISPDADGGYDCLREILDSTRPPSAFICGDSTLSAGAFRYLSELGAKVPDEISLVTYGESILGSGSLLHTHIRPPYPEMAQRAARLLLDRIIRSVRSPSLSVTFPGASHMYSSTLVSGYSTGTLKRPVGAP